MALPLRPEQRDQELQLAQPLSTGRLPALGSSRAKRSRDYEPRSGAYAWGPLGRLRDRRSMVWGERR